MLGMVPGPPRWLASNLPDRILPFGNQNSTGYKGGYFLGQISALAIPYDRAVSAAADALRIGIAGASDLNRSIAAPKTVAYAAQDTGAAAARDVSFIAKSNGEVIRVPEQATGPTPADNGLGFQFRGGSGGSPLSPRVAGARVMDPVASGKFLYPNGYVSYFNELDQPVNPFTGQTIGRSDPFWHWAWGP
jgi:hypothetical protein